MPRRPPQTVEIVTATGHDLVVQLKGHQPSLFQRLTTTYPRQPPVDRHHSHEVGRHSRIEQRTTRVWSLPPGAGTEPWHDHFGALMEVQRYTEVFQTRHQDWRERQETAYSLSTGVLTAAQAAEIIRGHGGIENRLHDVRDAPWGEDASRIRRHPGILVLLRSCALTLLRCNGITNLSLGRDDKALDFDRLLAYQGL